MGNKLFSSGWKSPSLVDVYNSVTFTVWACGCNLKCPFCHNWRLANNDPGVCKWADIGDIIEELSASSFLVDYLHVTGGEPLLQWRAISELFEGARKVGVRRSINSNLTLTSPLEKLLERGLVDHVATDLKLPYWELYGLPRGVSDALWRKFVESLGAIARRDIPLELRVPASSLLTREVLERALDEIQGYLSRISELVILVQPLYGPPLTEPRDPGWCKKYCADIASALEIAREVLEERGLGKVVVKQPIYK